MLATPHRLTLICHAKSTSETTPQRFDSDDTFGFEDVRRRARVLVVDDDRDLVRTLMTLLRDVGYEPHGVYAGRYVMGGVIDIDPDVVVLDINLPDLSGWEVAMNIRQRRGRERPALIGISGRHRGETEKALAMILGFKHYLVKPFEPTELIALLGSLSDQ